MAHEFETGFFVREPAWHGLGTIIQEAPTSEDAIRLAQLDWDVISSPIMVNNNEVEGYKANVRSSDNSVLGIVSDKYKIIQNTDAFAFVDHLLESGVKFESAGSLMNGKQVWLLANLPAEKILDDDVVPYLVFTNGHDGKNAVSVCNTPVRVVCKNTLNAALSGAKRKFTFRHMGDMEGKKFEASETLRISTSYMNSLRAFAETMAKKEISKKQLEKIIDQIFPMDEEASDRIKDNVSLMRNTFTDIYTNTDDLQNIRGTAWGVYNAFSDMATHMTPLRKTKNFQERRFISFLEGNELLDQAQEVLMAA